MEHTASHCDFLGVRPVYRNFEGPVCTIGGRKRDITDKRYTQPLKWFAITDEYTRECLALEVDRGITADRVVDVLTNLFLTRGVPRHIRSDNGPEFIA